METPEFEAALKDAEVGLDRLKSLYDQWFQGIERLEPAIQRKNLDRLINTLRRGAPRNTALRFRFQSMIQRYTTLQMYWKRVSRQIEEGTYRRDVRRAQRRKQATRSVRPAAFSEDVGTTATFAKAPKSEDRTAANTKAASPNESASQNVDSKPAFSSPSGTASFKRPEGAAPPKIRTAKMPAIPSDAKKPPPPPPSTRKIAAPKPPPPPPSKPMASKPMASKPIAPKLPPPPPTPRSPSRSNGSSSGMSDAQMRGLYDRYVAAKRRNNERVEDVKYESLARSVNKMMPRLKEKHRGKNIEFEVVTKDGRVGLKPVAK